MADVNDNRFELNEIQATGRFGDVVANLNSNFSLIIEAILKKRDGKSAYEIWVEQPGNEGKSVSEFLASLKESGFTSKAVLTLPTGSNIEENTIYAVPEKSDQALTDPDMWAEYIYQDSTWILMSRHPGSGLSSIISDILALQGRDEPIVFTESKEMNRFIRWLYVDTSNYSGGADVTDLYAYFFRNGSTIYLSLFNSSTGGDRILDYYFIGKGNGVYCDTLTNGIYIYVEVDEDNFPSASITNRAKLTSYALSRSSDPRVMLSGPTENPIINRFLKSLYIDTSAYTGDLSNLKDTITLYGLWNRPDYTTVYYFGFHIGSGVYNVVLSSNAQDSLIKKTYTLSNNGSITIYAVIDWDSLASYPIYFASEYIKLNPQVFDVNFFTGEIKDDDNIEIEKLKKNFSTRVFTEDGNANQVIKKLFFDTSGYTGSYSLEGLRATIARNISGLWGIQLRNGSNTIASFWVSSERGKISQTNTGVYMYAEFDWSQMPDASRIYNAILTNECLLPTNDPRKSVGFQNLTDEVVEAINSSGSGGSSLTPLTGGVYGTVGDSITEGAGIQASDSLSSADPFYPLSGTAKPTYGYLIAKVNGMRWRNYGISGSTLGDVTANGVSRNGFSRSNGRYTQLADDLTHISIFFGWNDHAYGHVMKMEQWLAAQYGETIYYPTSTDKIGTPGYATQEQYDAVMSVTGEVGGISYTDSINYWRAVYIGTPNDSTPYTFWGAWNIVLQYLINKYPLAKILVIVPYQTGKLMRQTVRDAAHKYGLPVYDFGKAGAQLFAYGWYDEDDVTGRINNVAIESFRRTHLLYDTAHPSVLGYKYMYPPINAKLNSI